MEPVGTTSSRRSASRTPGRRDRRRSGPFPSFPTMARTGANQPNASRRGWREVIEESSGEFRMKVERRELIDWESIGMTLHAARDLSDEEIAKVRRLLKTWIPFNS